MPLPVSADLDLAAGLVAGLAAGFVAGLGLAAAAFGVAFLVAAFLRTAGVLLAADLVLRIEATSLSAVVSLLLISTPEFRWQVDEFPQRHLLRDGPARARCALQGNCFDRQPGA